MTKEGHERGTSDTMEQRVRRIAAWMCEKHMKNLPTVDCPICLQFENQSLRERLTDTQHRNGKNIVRAEAAKLDAARYRIVRSRIKPKTLSFDLGIPWKDIPEDQTIEEKIDELCDAAICRGRGQGMRLSGEVCDLRSGEQPTPLKRVCNRPAFLRYRTSSGGYMYLCEEHGQKHKTYCERWGNHRWNKAMTSQAAR